LLTSFAVFLGWFSDLSKQSRGAEAAGSALTGMKGACFPPSGTGASALCGDGEAFYQQRVWVGTCTVLNNSCSIFPGKFLGDSKGVKSH